MNENYSLVYNSSNHIQAGIMKAKLQNEGIDVFSRGEILNSVTGEVSIEGGMIELFVHNDQLQITKEIIEQAESQSRQNQIVCPICNELNYTNFSHCWNCNNDLRNPYGDNRINVDEEKPQPKNYYLATTIFVIILLITLYNLR